MNYTKQTLKKLELLLEELGYIIRYEKGNFQSGYAIVKEQKIIIINKFFETEARINSLLDILALEEHSDEAILSEKSAKLLQQILRSNDTKNDNETA
ncbi:MAG: hypothetical protein HC912_09655 [Saprospiraceae bacterium]|nr:hypothetical protein [Saprospiraceae bacterium]